RRIKDTRVAAHIMAPHLSTALKNVADRLIDARSSQAQAKLQVGTWTWSTVPLDYDAYWTYAALDPVLTYRIGEVLFPQVARDAPDAFELENSVLWVIEQMQRYGARIDVMRAQEKLNAFTFYVDS